MAARWAAAAAVLGGAAWVLKAGLVLATGDEPRAIFGLGLVAFVLALLGLWSVVAPAGGRAARVGGILAAVTAFAGVLALIVRAVGGEDIEPADGEITLLTPFVTVASFGMFLALIALGLAVRRSRAFPHAAAWLPLAMGLSAVPLLWAAGVLETVNERLVEVPIAILGLAWMGLGGALWNAKVE